MCVHEVFQGFSQIHILDSSVGHKSALDIDFNGRTMTQEETATTFHVWLGTLRSWFDVYQRTG